MTPTKQATLSRTTQALRESLAQLKEWRARHAKEASHYNSSMFAYWSGSVRTWRDLLNRQRDYLL